MATPTPRVIRIEKNTNLIEVGVQPGWFVRHGSCSIWFEIKSVFDNMLIVAARNPNRNTNMVSVGNSFTSIDEVSSVAPPHSDWIKLDRTTSL